MLLEESPVFKRTYVPWYDTTGVCILTILLLDGVFLFSAAGISVARMAPAFYHHIWMPVLLMVASGGLMVSIVFRLIRRYVDRLRR